MRPLALLALACCLAAAEAQPVTTAYGLKIEDMVGTTKYAIYTGTGDVRFGGAVTCSSTLTVTNAIQTDTDGTAGNTRLFVYDVDNGTLERVSVGAADSGGSGYKVLRIPN